jgi:glycolate oxidase
VRNDSEADLETISWVRDAWNPKGLANPGKIFPTPRTCGEAARAKSEMAKRVEGVDLF